MPDQTAKTIPAHIQRQHAALIADPETDEQVLRAKYAELVAWVKARVSLADVIRDSGVELRPLSPDSPDILVGSGCPSCGKGPLFVMDGAR